jgi:hypothetical protein
MLTWGLVSGLTAFIWSDWSFYGARFLLGLAEGGFYPGVVLYLTWWFPSRYRARMMALFQSASVISLFIGLPIGSLLTRRPAGTARLAVAVADRGRTFGDHVGRHLEVSDGPARGSHVAPAGAKGVVERTAGDRASGARSRPEVLVTGGIHQWEEIWMLTIAYLGQKVRTYRSTG